MVSTYTKSVIKTIEGREITINGEEGNKTYIKQDDRSRVLKLESEVEKAEQILRIP